MQALLHTTLLIFSTFALVVAALAMARRRLPANADPVVRAVEALLPQTQCAQCGYPGCGPYAQALVAGAPLDLCAPGGAATQGALARLLGREPGAPIEAPQAVSAKIDESACVGCFLCVEACPVDAIVGAPKFMHTVIEARCTGCGLCLPPCPMDCIALEPVAIPAPAQQPPAAQPCIRCNRCEPVCPADLAPQALWWFARGADLDLAERLGLDRCIECAKCNAECPSGIDLSGVFRSAKSALAARRHADALADRARTHYEQHERRIAGDRLLASDRRRRRIAAGARDGDAQSTDTRYRSER